MKLLIVILMMLACTVGVAEEVDYPHIEWEFAEETPSSSIIFTEVWDFVLITSTGEEIIKIKQNGDFYIKGKLVDNDKEIFKALQDFFCIKTEEGLEVK